MNFACLFKIRRHLIILFVIILGGYLEAIAEELFSPNIFPNLRVPRISETIKVDGKLDDAGWRAAAIASNFCENNPGDMVKPPVRTDVFAAYDETNFYMAFIAYDDPKTLRVSMCDRDEAWQDDVVGIILDTYGDAAWAYEIFCNAIGIQGDIRWTNSNEDMSFDMVFQSAGAVTDSGYQVEMAIPFKSLRFPNKSAQTWRATFWRNHPRATRGQYTWAAISKDASCFPCQFGTLSGIENVKPGLDMALLPSVTGFQSASIRDDTDPHSGLEQKKIDGRLSLGARYSLSSSSSIEAAWKPDFSQVESDVAQIDVNSTFALFYPEHRPFFQEGYDLFETPFNAVYTRSINDPMLAAKFVGRMKRTSIAYLGGRDDHSPIILPFEESGEVLLAGKSTTNIARLKQTFAEDSYIGGLFTWRVFDHGGSGALGGVDGKFRFSKRYSLKYQALASRTEEPDDSLLSQDIEQTNFDRGRYTAALDGESFTGHAYIASLSRDAKFWNFSLDYFEKSPTFRADNGFVAGNDVRMASFWSNLTFYPEKSWITRVSPNINGALKWNFAGVRKDVWIEPEIYAQFVGQSEFELNYLWSEEKFRDIVFKGIQRAEGRISSNFSRLLSPGIFVSYGRSIARNLDTPVLGKGYDITLWSTFKLWSRFVMQPEWDYSRLDYPGGGNIFKGYILRTRFNYQFSRELLARVILQYDDFDRNFNFEPLLSYKLNPFTIFYIGSSQAYEKFDGEKNSTPVSRQYFLKLQYLVGL